MEQHPNIDLDRLAETYAHEQPVRLESAFVQAHGISAAALMSAEFPAINYIIPGYICEGLTVFAGAPKIGKSWLALGWAVAVAGGRPAFGSISCDPGDVLYLALEDNRRRLQKRLRHMRIAEVPERLTFMTEWPDLDGGCLNEVDAWIRGRSGARLIVIDVLAKVRGTIGGKETLYEADYRIVSGLQELAGRYGLAIVVVHHTRKMEAEDPFDSVSGTRGLTGGADTVMVLKREIGSNRTILYGRGRDVEEIETALEFDGETGTWRIIGAAHEVARTTERQAILDTLKASADPLGARDVSDLIGQPYPNVRRTLARMAQSGEVAKVGRGQYGCPNGPNVSTDWDNETDETGGADQ